VRGLLSPGVVPVKAIVLVDMVGSVGLIWSWLIRSMMDSAESDFFVDGVGDGAMIDPGESGLFTGEGDLGSDPLCRGLGGSLGVTTSNTSLIEGRVSCSVTSSVDDSVTSSPWSGNPSISSCAVGGLRRPLYCSMSRRLLPNRSPPCVVSIKS
jgi:hypothetical protein